MRFCVLSCLAILVSATIEEQNEQLERTNTALQHLLERLELKQQTERAVAQDEVVEEADPTSCVGVICPSNQNCHQGKCVRDRHTAETSVGVGELAVAGTNYAEWNCYACNDHPDYEYCSAGSGNELWKTLSGICVPKGTCTNRVYTECRSFEAQFKGDYACFPNQFAPARVEDYPNTDLYDCSLKCLANPKCEFFSASYEDKKCELGIERASTAGLTRGYSTGPVLCGYSRVEAVMYEIYRDPYPEDPGYARWNCQGCIDSPNHDWCWWNEQGNVQVACAPKVGDGFGVPCTGVLDKVLPTCFENHKFLKEGCTHGGVTKDRGEQAEYWCGNECENDPECIMFSWTDTWKCQLHYEYHKCGTLMTLSARNSGVACMGFGRNVAAIYQVSNYDQKRHC